MFMRTLIVGAAGPVGERLVAAAQQAGHEVVSLTSRPVPRGRSRGAPGHLRDPQALRAALAGADGVLWCPGDLVTTRPQDATELVRDLAREMDARGPSRLVFLSSLGAAECRRRATVVSAVLLVRLFRGPEVQEAEAQERHVRASALDWTIVRAGTLFEGPRTGRYRVGVGVADVPLDAHVSYADAADFMLAELTRRDRLNATVNVFY